MIAASKRLRRRLLEHHLPLFGGSAIFATLLFVTRPYADTISRASFATAYPAVILFAWTLVPGAWHTIRRRPNPVSQDLRRDVGIWAGILSLIHVAIGQNMHLRGRPWLYYVYGPTEHKTFPIRHDLFGFANYTGALSTIVVILLLATSNDYFLRRLDTPQWKRLQRWNYAAFALAAIHAVAYQVNEKQKLPFVLIVAACILVACGFQLAGYIARKRARRSAPTATTAVLR